MDSGGAIVFGRRLAEERKRLGLKQAEFAALIGIHPSKQSLYETGVRDLRASYLASAAAAGVDILFVLTGERLPPVELGTTTERMLVSYLSLPRPVQSQLEQFVCALPDALSAKRGRPKGSKRALLR